MGDSLISNGVLVYRMWGDGSNELLAIMQYATDAEAFCDATEQAKGVRIVTVNTFDGRMKVVSVGAPEGSA
jgi:hypothetical protein